MRRRIAEENVRVRLCESSERSERAANLYSKHVPPIPHRLTRAFWITRKENILSLCVLCVFAVSLILSSLEIAEINDLSRYRGYSHACGTRQIDLSFRTPHASFEVPVRGADTTFTG